MPTVVVFRASKTGAFYLVVQKKRAEMSGGNVRFVESLIFSWIAFMT